MEAWRNISSLNFSTPVLQQPSPWLAAMNLTTSQWRLANFTGNLTITPGWIDNLTAMRLPNDTIVIEGIGAYYVGSKPLNEFVGLVVMGVVILLNGLFVLRWILAVQSTPRQTPAAPQTERDFWDRVRPFYDRGDSREEAAAEASNPVGPFGPADVRRVAALLRQMHALEVEVAGNADAIGVDLEAVDNRKRHANALWAEICARVDGWDKHGLGGAAGWTGREVEDIGEMMRVIRAAPMRRFHIGA